MADPQSGLDIDRVILFELDVDRAQGAGNEGDTAPLNESPVHSRHSARVPAITMLSRTLAYAAANGCEAVKINHDSFRENFLNVLKVGPKSKMSSMKQEGVHRHDATWKLPVVDHLASATECKVQDLARPLVRARSETSQNRPPLVALGLATARGGLALSESPGQTLAPNAREVASRVL